MDMEAVARAIVNCSFKVHKTLGPGLLEKIYESCLVFELKSAGLDVQRQVPVSIQYGNLTFEEGYRLDLLVENKIICEIKAVEKHNPVWEAQLLSYMRLKGCRLGFLINFNVPLIKNGIKRIIL